MGAHANVCRWEQQGCAALKWGSDCMRLKTYGVHDGFEVWSEVARPWKLYVVELRLQLVGSNICRDTCINALRNLCRRQARNSYHHLLPAHEVPESSSHACVDDPGRLTRTPWVHFGTGGMILPYSESTCLCNTRGAGILGNRISCLKPPPEPNLKKGGVLGGGLRGFFAVRGYCPRKQPPGPPNPPPPH